jgi:putative Holliday junction resolvase
MEKRYLAVDLGTKRIGFALSDPLNIIASAYETWEWKGKNLFIKDILPLIEEKNIGTIVFGLPISLSGQDSQKTKEIRELVEFFREKIPKKIRIELEDETYTSKEAEDIIRQMGRKPSKNKAKIDQIAAQRILQSYMNRI